MKRNRAQQVLVGMGVAGAMAWVVVGDPGQPGSGESGLSAPTAVAPADPTGGGETPAPYDPMQDYVETLQWWHVHPDWGASPSEPSCRVEP